MSQNLLTNPNPEFDSVVISRQFICQIDLFFDKKVTYQLGGVVDDDEICPGIPEAEVSLVIHLKQLTHARDKRTHSIAVLLCAFKVCVCVFTNMSKHVALQCYDSSNRSDDGVLQNS